MLIEKNAETNIKDSSGKTLLWAALDNDDIETAKLLISKGNSPLNSIFAWQISPVQWSLL